MKPHRSLQLGVQIKREIAGLLRAPQEDLADFFITVTEVRMAKDLKTAEVWVSIMGGSDQRKAALKALESSNKRLRYELSQSLNLRFTPELRFTLDETLDYAERIDTILRSEGLLNGNGADAS